MADSNVFDRMRQDWNARAREDPHYYVAFGRRDQADADFFATATDVLRGLRGELRHLRPPGQRLPANLKALEIGCGPGRLMRPLSADFAEIHGIDVSDEMIRLASEKLRGIPNAYAHHAARSDLSIFADESFDFVYSYAVFQHIPSREVVLAYLAEARRVLKPGGILRCQINGLPEAFRRYTTWDGVRIPAEDVAAFALRHDFQLYALENVATQYLWTTWRKRPSGWRAALRPTPSPATRIRIISNALTADPLVPASGPRAFAALRIESLPADCDLFNLEVRIDGRAGVLSYLGPPEWDGVVQLNAAIPPGTRTGLVPVDVLWLGQPLTQTWMRIVPPGPAVPRLCDVRDGENLLAGARIISRIIKVVMEEIAEPERVEVAIDDVPVEPFEIFCTDPLQRHYDINLTLPPGTSPGPHHVNLTLGWRRFGPVPIEVV
ncbi:MAG TPA: methyltransferase domain-containing protein [Bryobacteraceae bacterium]|nr:methyltransferase domain-containing protein [Bryobacteraceae bacterium]